MLITSMIAYTIERNLERCRGARDVICSTLEDRVQVFGTTHMIWKEVSNTESPCVRDLPEVGLASEIVNENVSCPGQPKSAMNGVSI